jgi:cysteine desulfurase
MEAQQSDLTGLKCPLPIVELNKLIRQIPIGEELVAAADDPAFRLDVEAWCRKTGNELVRLEPKGERLVVVIRRNV